MISNRRLARAALATGFAWLCITACGGSDDSARSAAPATAGAAPSPAPELEKGKPIRYSGETPEGTTFTAQLGGDVTLPANLPDTLPLYPNGVPYSALEADDTALITIDSEDDPAEIYEFYLRKLPVSGWTIQNELNLGAQRIVTAVNGDRKVVLQIDRTERGARIAIAVSPAG